MKIFFPSGAFDELETNDLMWMNYTSQETNATWTHILDENNSTELETNDFIWMNDTSQEKNATWTYIVEENSNTAIETNDLIWDNDTRADYNATWMYNAEENNNGTYYDELDENHILMGQISDNTSERKRGL